MDLLGGYDSNSDSDSNSSSPESGTKKNPSVSSKSDISHVDTPTRQVHTGASKSESKSKSTTSKISRRGKRLLKLQSVLPQHIWNKLTNDQFNSDSDGDDDDDNDDGNNKNNDTENNKRNGKNIQSMPFATKSTTNQLLDKQTEELSDLLMALPKSKKGSLLTSVGSAGSASTGGILGNMNTTTIPKREVVETTDKKIDDSKSSTGLGFAFISSTVEVSRAKKDEVRSIHQNNQQHNQQDHHSKDSASIQEKTGNFQANDEKSDGIVKETTINNFPKIKAIPRPSSFIQSAAPRPRSASRNAAPQVRSAPLRASNYMATGQAAQDYQHSSTQRKQAPPVQMSRKTLKRQREAMLRAGNLSIESDIDLQGGGNSNYAAEAIAAQAAASAAPGYQAHGVRVVPTSQYNTSTGQMTASTSVSGQAKGKNQLGALLANAASLEASRMENPQLQTRKVNRSNAKRKYGW